MNWEKLQEDILEAIANLDNIHYIEKPKLNKKQRYRLNRRLKARQHRLTSKSQKEELLANPTNTSFTTESNQTTNKQEKGL